MEQTKRNFFRHSFSNDFVEDLYKVLEKHDISDSLLCFKIWAEEVRNCDREDCQTWLRDNDHEDLADDEGFVGDLLTAYEHMADSNFGTWDNIENAFNSIYEEDEEEDGDETNE